MNRTLNIFTLVFKSNLIALLIGLFLGFDKGLSEGSGFSIAGETGPQFLIRCYVLIGVCVVFFAFGLFIQSRKFSILICMIILIMELVIYCDIFRQKSYALQLGASNNLYEISFAIDVSIVALILFLLSLQLIQLYSEIFYIRNHKKHYKNGLH